MNIEDNGTERTLEDLISLIDNVSKTCSNEFYAWKKQYVADCLKEIQLDARSPSIRIPQSDGPSRGVQDVATFDEDNQSSFMHTMDIWHFPVVSNPSQPTIQSTTLSVETFRHQAATDFLEPMPPYEACVPVNRNVVPIGAPGDTGILKFIPFGDVPEFINQEGGLKDFLENSEGVEDWAYAWEFPDRDPDVDAIEREVIWRLLNEHGLTFDEMRVAGKFSPRFLAEDGTFRDIADTRSLLPWPIKDPASGHPFPPRSREYMQANSLDKQCKMFCASLSCIHSLCETHGDNPQSIPPKLQHHDLQHYKSQCKEPCENDCFQNSSSRERSKWSAIDIQDLTDLLDTISDIGVCDLAFLLQKSCTETFYQLCALSSVKNNIDDEWSSEESSGVVIVGPRKPRPKRRFPGQVMDHRPVHFEYVKPCNHTGECSRETRCECFSSNVYCKRNCLCSPDCVRRFRGCNSTCKKTSEGSLCGPSSSCRCVINNRECDPEVCKNCRPKSGDHRCSNSSIQRGHNKLLKVVSKTYSWGPGWGVEVAEDVKDGEFLAEYVGESISVKEVGYRFPHDQWLGRVYNFTLDSTQTLDSSRAGNETKFINHDPGENINCCSKSLMVNGEVRIGFFATKDIKAGEELFFNYGPSFFRENDSE